MSVEKDFDGGIVIEGLASISQQQLVDYVTGAKPTTNKALVISDSTAPDVASNPRFSRYLWFDTANNLLKYYNGSSWVGISVGNITTTGQIADNIVTIAKLKQDEGSNGTILHKHASTGAVEWITLTSLLTPGVIPVSALAVGGAGDGSFLRYKGSAVGWDASATVAAEVAASITSYDIHKLSGRTNDSLLSVDGAGVISFKDVQTWFNDLLPGTIPLAALDTFGATDGQVATYFSGNVIWKTPASIFTKSYQGDDTYLNTGNTIFAQGVEGIRTFVHGLGTTPTLIRATLVCHTADVTNGYSIGDEINVEAFSSDTSGQETNTFGIFATATEVRVSVNYVTGSNQYFHQNFRGGAASIDTTKWRIRVRAYA